MLWSASEAMQAFQDPLQELGKPSQLRSSDCEMDHLLRTQYRYGELPLRFSGRKIFLFLQRDSLSLVRHDCCRIPKESKCLRINSGNFNAMY